MFTVLCTYNKHRLTCLQFASRGNITTLRTKKPLSSRQMTNVFNYDNMLKVNKLLDIRGLCTFALGARHNTLNYMQIVTDIRAKSCLTILKAARSEQAMKHRKCLTFLQMMLFAAYPCKC